MALPRRSSQSRSPQTFRDHLANIPLPAFRMPAIGTTVAAVLLSVLIWQKSCNSEEDIRPYLPDRMRKEISDEELKLYSRTAHEMVEKGFVFESDATKQEIKQAVHQANTYLDQQGIDKLGEKQEFQAYGRGLARSKELPGTGSLEKFADGDVGPGTLALTKQAVEAENVPNDKPTPEGGGGDNDDVNVDGYHVHKDQQGNLAKLPRKKLQWVPTSDLQWPFPDANQSVGLRFEKKLLTSVYGDRQSTGTFHAGRDIRASVGTPVSADNEGKVVTARFQDTAIKITIRGEDYTFDTPGHIPQRILEYAHKHGYDLSPGYGKHVIIDHGDGTWTLYGHLSEMFVKEGDIVQKGQVVCKSGDTGLGAPHLHFEIREGENKRSSAVSPDKYFDLKNEGIGGWNWKTRTGVAGCTAIVLGGVLLYHRRRNRRP